MKIERDKGKEEEQLQKISANGVFCQQHIEMSMDPAKFIYFVIYFCSSTYSFLFGHNLFLFSFLLLNLTSKMTIFL